MKKLFILLGLLCLTVNTAFAVQDSEEILYDDSSSNVIFGDIKKQEIYSLNNYSTQAKNSGASVDILTREDIQGQNTAPMSQLLNQTMGVTYGQSSGGYGQPSKLIIRGSDRVLFSVDGVRIDNPAGTARTTDLQNYLMSDDIERIEVIRGPQGTISGHNATGGLVAVRTRRGSGRLQIEAESLFGNYSSFKERLAIMGGGEKFDHYTAINWFKTDDGTWIEGIGRYGDNAYNNLGIVGNYGIRFLDGKAELRDVVRYNRGRKNLGMNYYNIGQNYPGYDDKDYSVTQDFSNSLTWAHEVNKYYDYDIKTSIFNHNYAMNYISAENEPWGEDYGVRTNATRFDIGTQQNFNLAKWNRLSVGYNFEVENYRTNTDNGLYSSYYMRGHTYQNDVYLQDAINIKDILFIKGGVRYSHHSQYGGWLAPNASAALVLPTFKLEGAKTTFRGSWGMNRNNPTLYQRFGNTGAMWGNVLPNENLKPEKMQSWDVGVNQSFFNDKLSFDFGYFQSNYTDYINYEYVDYWTYNGFYTNIDEARIYGYEGKITWTPNEKFKFVLNYTYTDAKDTGNNEPLPLVSKNRINGTIIWSPIERFSAYIGVEAGDERAYSQGKTLPGYVDVNMGGQVRLFTWNNISLYLKGDLYNLLNQKIACGYAGNYRIYSPGINFRLGLFLKYNLPEKDKL